MAASPHLSAHYPIPSEEALRQELVGKLLGEVDAPAAVLDLAVLRENCDSMLRATEALGVRFRAHVKTHKTIPLTSLQLGTHPRNRIHPSPSDPLSLIVSTLPEAQHLLPFLLETRAATGRPISLLYGLPLPPSKVPALASLARALGPGSLSILLDHPAGVAHARALAREAGVRVGVFVKVDTGYHRSGVGPTSASLAGILQGLAEGNAAGETDGNGGAACVLQGLYSHLGSSYSGSSPTDALTGLHTELTLLRLAASQTAHLRRRRDQPLILSVGATPTATAAELVAASSSPSDGEDAAQGVRTLVRALRADDGLAVELHAGVYPTLDLQQLATHARPGAALSPARIGLRVLVEVASVYGPDEGRPGGKAEALVAAGSLALGREPCRGYPGWGVVSGWVDRRAAGAEGEGKGFAVYDEGTRRGWIVGRVSQEHGILTWEGSKEGEGDGGTEAGCFRPLRIGERLLVWPNHACIAGAGFAYYLVVDGEGDDPDRVVDVWVRCRGW